MIMNVPVLLLGESKGAAIIANKDITQFYSLGDAYSSDSKVCGVEMYVSWYP